MTDPRYCSHEQIKPHGEGLQCMECNTIGEFVPKDDIAANIQALSSSTRDSIMQAAVIYHRQTLVDILVYHYRKDITGCGCGWAELGKSWPEHIANIYEESIISRIG